MSKPEHRSTKKILKKEGKRETDKPQKAMLKTSSMKEFLLPS